MTRKSIALAAAAAFGLAVLAGGSAACKSKKTGGEMASDTLGAAASGPAGAKAPGAGPAAGSGVFKAPDITERLAKFSPTELGIDAALLKDEDRAVLRKLIEASRIVDEIFWRQAYPPGRGLREELARSTDPADRDYVRFMDINFGPFDRQDENRPFYGTAPKPKGAGFYPEDMTKEEFEGHVATLPAAEKEAFESPFTVIRRREGRLVAVPYSEEYGAELDKISALLKEAAGLTTNASLKAYLGRRAADLLSNDYYESDCLWIDLQGNAVETILGPYEVYEDGLLGLKASFESFVYVNDFPEMAKLRGYLDHLEDMQRSLPVEAKHKSAVVRGLSSPLNVVQEAFTAGDTKAGVQTSAFVLPNDEKVREKKGTKKVFLKNMMEAKFSKSLTPIAGRVLRAEDAALVTFDAYFIEVILHEICHVLGVNYIALPDGTKTTVNKALKDLNTPIEEAKADVLGVYSVPLLIGKGLIPAAREKEIYASYLAGMFRAMRFGATEAHGLGVLCQFNFLRDKRAFVLDEAAGRYRVDDGAIKPGLRDLARELLVIEGEGSYEGAKAFIAKYGTMNEGTKKILEGLKDIPVDIAPVFKEGY